MTRSRSQGSLADTLSRAVFEALLAATVCFTAAAYGGVEDWAEPVILWLVTALAVAAIVREGVSRDRPGRAWAGVYVLLAAFIGLAAVQILPLPWWLLGKLAPNSAEIYQRFAYDLQDAPIGGPGSWLTVSLCPSATWRGLRLLVAFSVVLLLVIRHVGDLAAIRRLFACVTAVSVGLAFLTLIHTYGWDTRPFDAWQVPGLAHPPLGLLVNPNQFAVFANLAVGFGLGLALLQLERIHRHRKARGLTWPSTFSDRRAVAFALLVVGIGLLAGMAFLSLSRGGMIASFVGASALAFTMLARRRAGWRTWALACMIAATVGVVGWFGWEAVAAELATLDRPWGQIAQEADRPQIWKDALHGAWSHAFLGAGLGTFELVYPIYRTIQGAGLFTDAHNEFVQLTLEVGMLGTALLLVFLVAVAIQLARALRSTAGPEATALAGGCLYALTACVVQTNLTAGMHVPANALLFAVLCAAICALAQAQRASSRTDAAAAATGKRRRSTRRTGPGAGPVARKRWVGGVVATALASVTCLLAVDSGKSARAAAHHHAAWTRVAPYTNAGSAIPRDDFLAAARHLQAAVQHRPRDGKLRYALAALAWHQHFGQLAGPRLQEAVRRPASAPVINAIREALQQVRLASPTFGYSHLLLAQIDALAGADSAGKFAQRAIELLPADPDAWRVAGNFDLAEGQVAEACRKYRRAIALGGHRDQIVRLMLDDPALAARLPEALPDRPDDLLFAADKSADRYPALTDKLLASARELIRRQAPEAKGREGGTTLAALGRLERRLGRLDAAAGAIDRALRLNYNNIALRHEYARVLEDLGRPGDAEKQLRLCLRIRPGHRQTRTLLGRIVEARIRTDVPPANKIDRKQETPTARMMTTTRDKDSHQDQD